MYPVRTSAELPAVLNEVLRGILQFLQANTTIAGYLEIAQNRLLPNFT